MLDNVDQDGDTVECGNCLWLSYEHFDGVQEWLAEQLLHERPPPLISCLVIAMER